MTARRLLEDRETETDIMLPKLQRYFRGVRNRVDGILGRHMERGTDETKAFPFDADELLPSAEINSLAEIIRASTARVSRKTFDIIKERAKTFADAEKYSALLKAKGLDSLIDGAGQWEKEENREFVIRGAMASHITSCRDGDGKLQLLIGLSRDHPGPEAVAYLDEITAEILDGAAAVMEVLGGQPDAAAANRKLINLSCGRCQPPKKPISCIVELNDMIARLDMPLTRQVLLERVENEIGGIRPLTREGKTVDREAFAVLVRELAEDDGLMGGPGMGAAVVGRARITLTKDESDLSAEQAIDHLLDLMPNRAVRLGFLLDLAASALFEKEGDVI